MTVMGLFTKQVEPKDPIAEFYDAIEVLNTAWENLPAKSKLRPWIDWENREVVAVLPFNPARVTREEAEDLT